MTRVSDRVAFARDVAAEGGLPFLALALMSGSETATLVAEASGLSPASSGASGDPRLRSSGVAEAQLEAVRSVRPPFALIAGGRAAQAAALEADGIATYLHVPSPGLLDRFLTDGARRFVFEGSECGGHIGPRASFPLWEAQVEHLLAFGDDKRHGPSFYEALHVPVRLRRTRRTVGRDGRRRGGPGRARCHRRRPHGDCVPVHPGGSRSRAPSSRGSRWRRCPANGRCCLRPRRATSPGAPKRRYVAAFQATKDRLAGAGTGQQEMWAALEQLNLGRLRIASKGLRPQR